MSSAHFQNVLCVSDSSYRRAVEDLLEAGYLIMRNGNEHTLDFYTTPQPTNYVKKERKKKTSTSGVAANEEPAPPVEEPLEPPMEEDEENWTYSSAYASSPYRWEP